MGRRVEPVKFVNKQLRMDSRHMIEAKEKSEMKFNKLEQDYKLVKYDYNKLYDSTRERRSNHNQLKRALETNCQLSGDLDETTKRAKVLKDQELRSPELDTFETFSNALPLQARTGPKGVFIKTTHKRLTFINTDEIKVPITARVLLDRPRLGKHKGSKLMVVFTEYSNW